MAMDAWMVKIKMMDGSCQVLEGLSVEKVTAEFPEISIKAAVNEVKTSKPKDTQLQNIKVPDKVGGNVDILLGIKYNAFFPVLVHMLPNGLGIYKLKVKSFGNKFTGVIAGPHSSFDKLLQKVGNAAYLLHIFTEGLQTWRTLGAPKLEVMRTPIMTEEDMMKARHLNGMEYGVNCQLLNNVTTGQFTSPGGKGDSRIQSQEEFRQKGSDLRIQTQEEFRRKDSPIASTMKIPEAILEEPEVLDNAICVNCGDLMSREEDSDAIFKDVEVTAHITAEKTGGSNKMKRLADVQDAGLQIEYRCPKCRQCSDCLKPIETEKVSLREEAETVTISGSVRLDMENKRIICNLPLRREETEFLSTNRVQAEKILNQQCSRYFRDEETKPVILKAFKKLFDNDHAKLLRDLPVETVNKILSNTTK